MNLCKEVENSKPSWFAKQNAFILRQFGSRAAAHFWLSQKATVHRTERRCCYVSFPGLGIAQPWGKTHHRQLRGFGLTCCVF
jgi:hypothetical protein